MEAPETNGTLQYLEKMKTANFLSLLAMKCRQTQPAVLPAAQCECLFYSLKEVTATSKNDGDNGRIGLWATSRILFIRAGPCYSINQSSKLICLGLVHLDDSDHCIGSGSKSMRTFFGN